MLWVYGQYKKKFSVGIDFRRQNQTSVDVRFWRLMSIPTLTGLNLLLICHGVLYNKEWQADKHTIGIKVNAGSPASNQAVQINVD